MTKREPLKEWWAGTEPAPKTTVLKLDWWSVWVVVPQGRTLPDSDHDTWAEAMEAATR